jgi:hypothetical protein
MKSAVEIFFKYFLFKIIETKNFIPDAPTDLGDFPFFALSLIECKRQITCYVGGGGGTQEKSTVEKKNCHLEFSI